MRVVNMRIVNMNVVSMWAFAIMMTTVSLLTPANAQNLTLRRKHGQIYLVSGSARLLIDLPPPPSLTYVGKQRLPNDTVVTFRGESIHIESPGRADSDISLKDTLEQWLPDENKWGGHALEQVFLDEYNLGELSFDVSEPVVYKGALLAILNLRSTHGPNSSIRAQQLVRVQTSPTPALLLLRYLDVPRLKPTSYYSSIRRLFLVGENLLLFEHFGDPSSYKMLKTPASAPVSELNVIDAGGKVVRTAAKFPSPLSPNDFTGEAIINDRWVVLHLELDLNRTDVPAVWLHDMQRHITTALPVAVRRYGDYVGVSMPVYGDTMPYVALKTINDGQGKDALKRPAKIFVFHLPDGKLVSTLPAPNRPDLVTLWNGLVVVEDVPQNRLSVYKAQTGQRLKTFVLQSRR